MPRDWTASRYAAGAMPEIPAGYVPFIMPTAGSGYDNKDQIRQFLTDPNNGVLTSTGSPYTTPIGTGQADDPIYGQTFFLSPDKYAQMQKPFDTNPHQESDAMSVIGPALAVASMFVPGLQPIATGLNIGQGLGTGNYGQAIGGALGLPGVGSAVTGAIGSGLSDLGVPASFLPYATKGVMGAGIGLASGQGVGGALAQGVASGAGAYAGHQIADWTGGLPNFVTDGLSQAGAGAVGSAIRGQDIGRGAMASGMNGFISGLGKDFGFSPGVSGGAANLFGQFQQQRQQQYGQNDRMAQLRQRIASSRNQNPSTSTPSSPSFGGFAQTPQNQIDPAKLAQLKQRIAGVQGLGG